MISLLRKPDFIYGATEKTAFRFEEQGLCDVQYDYDVAENCAKITIYPSGSPVKYLKLRLLFFQLFLIQFFWPLLLLLIILLLLVLFLHLNIELHVLLLEFEVYW